MSTTAAAQSCSCAAKCEVVKVDGLLVTAGEADDHGAPYDAHAVEDRLRRVVVRQLGHLAWDKVATVAAAN